MAVFRVTPTLGGKKHQAIIRKGGHALSRTFFRIREAEDWARRVEDAIASATPERPFDRKAWLPLTGKEARERSFDDSKPHAGWTVTRALEKWKDDVSQHRKGAAEEAARVRFWQGTAIGDRELGAVTAEDVQAIVNERVEVRAGDTVRREVNVLRSAWTHARKVWKVEGLASLAELDLPTKGRGRDRRLQDGHGDQQGEEDRLRAALATWKRSPEIHVDLFDFSILTGFRLSEAHALTVGSIRRVRGVASAFLPDSKNGEPRSVILSEVAREIADRLSEGQDAKAKLFRISDSARRRAWAHARQVAGVDDLRWHDLRHEAISRMVERLPINDAMAQAGHRDMASTKGYSHSRPSDIVKRLG